MAQYQTYTLPPYFREYSVRSALQLAPTTPHCLPVFSSQTHSVFSPAFVGTEQFQPFCLLGETNIKPLYQIKMELTADHNTHAFSF